MPETAAYIAWGTQQCSQGHCQSNFKGPKRNPDTLTDDNISSRSGDDDSESGLE